MNKYELISAILDRAEAMGFCKDRLSNFMDLSFAATQFDLQLAEFLDADRLSFAHDFFGIVKHMNRETHQVEEFFLPRFAKKGDK